MDAKERNIFENRKKNVGFSHKKILPENLKTEIFGKEIHIMLFCQANKITTRQAQPLHGVRLPEQSRIPKNFFRKNICKIQKKVFSLQIWKTKSFTSVL